MRTFENPIDKLAHLSQPEIRVDARMYPEFAANFWIKRTDAAAVTEFLSGDKIRFLEVTKLKGTLATNANYLVYYEGGKLVTENDFDSFIATAESIAANFV
jgi:1-aminocyclopropane-1-carboxylate deaminase/D-cysteine desulfhydrase-like pyridoxal-dependent ACC family enzyme